MTKYFIKLLIGILIFGNFFCSFGQSSVIKYSNNYYSAGVNSQTFNYIASIGKQRADNWCWAACTQMVLNYHGLYVTQEQIVKKCFGGLYNAPGGTLEMFTALNGWAYNTRGGVSNIYTNNYPTNANEIQSLLANDWPLIVGLNYGTDVGHAYVLTAIYYSLSYDAYGNLIVIPDKVVLRDPWPYNNSRQEMSWAEFSTYVVSVYKVWVVDVPTSNSYTSRQDYFDQFQKKEDENKGKYKWVASSGFSFLETGKGLPFTFFLERYNNTGKISLRSNFQFLVKKQDFTKNRNHSLQFYALNFDAKKIFVNTKRYWNWYLSGSVCLNFIKKNYSSRQVVSNGVYTNNYIDSIVIKRKVVPLIRFGRERKFGDSPLRLALDLGLGPDFINKSFYADINILIGLKF
jgi:hypothetical protein